MSDEYFNKIAWDEKFGHPVRKIGSIPVTFGLMARADDDEAEDTPAVYAAALSERELGSEGDAGYGATPSEAAADLFRLLRPDNARDIAAIFGRVR